ncbi:hypothetical protein TNIN_343931 [Trichonephila inaurata madagascariensis]|uniref:Major facilitator superfamily (MFS) profile domain-containing protein n=1 Tax=Trichonephila inaurata madagascariensis TaxID=2747483 RepID=A0A8X6XS74_9ARAC|nr:hypothetical protein TNIN_343931 [Trichonephila inaurata madagascariensis]
MRISDQLFVSLTECAGVRYMFVVAGFLGMSIMYALRVNMSIAIIAMVNMTAVNPHLDNLTHEPMCAVFNPPLETSHMEFAQVHNGEFFWTPKLQGVVIGSFYYGYSISQVPGARLAEIYSGKWIFGLGTGISAVLSLLIPVAAYFHIAALILIRALQGLAQGVTFPAMYNLLGRWIREEEKTLVEAIVISGINIGTVVGMPLAAKLSNSDVFGGWPSAFYVIGIIGCIWFLFWSTFVTNSPSEQPCITPKELAHIGTKEIDHSKKPIPWLKILTFRPFWAAAFAQLVGDWTFFLLLNNLPTFYSTILNFNIETVCPN